MKKTHVLSVGGSIVAPTGELNISLLKKLKALLAKMSRSGHRFIIVVGGGSTCRKYQDAARKAGVKSKDDLDWIGIACSRANAELVRSIFGGLASDKIVTDPTKPVKNGKVIVAGGWKPGWSTDYVAVKLAKKYKAQEVINLSNIKYVFDKDPAKHKNAKPVKNIEWKDFKKLVGNKWDPGLNMPFDPIATKLAARHGMEVVVADGKNLENLEKILKGKSFTGTKIG